MIDNFVSVEIDPVIVSEAERMLTDRQTPEAAVYHLSTGYGIPKEYIQRCVEQAVRNFAEQDKSKGLF